MVNREIQDFLALEYSLNIELPPATSFIRSQPVDTPKDAYTALHEHSPKVLHKPKKPTSQHQPRKQRSSSARSTAQKPTFSSRRKSSSPEKEVKPPSCDNDSHSGHLAKWR